MCERGPSPRALNRHRWCKLAGEARAAVVVQHCLCCAAQQWSHVSQCRRSSERDQRDRHGQRVSYGAPIACCLFSRKAVGYAGPLTLQCCFCSAAVLLTNGAISFNVARASSRATAASRGVISGRVIWRAIASNGLAAAAGSGCTKLLPSSPAAEMPASRFLLLTSAAADLLACCCLCVTDEALGRTTVKQVVRCDRTHDCSRFCSVDILMCPKRYLRNVI
jgi:hypothetical protein